MFTEDCMSEVRQIFGRKCEQVAGRQLLLEQLINMHKKNSDRYWVPGMGIVHENANFRGSETDFPRIILFPQGNEIAVCI